MAEAGLSLAFLAANAGPLILMVVISSNELHVKVAAQEIDDRSLILK